ncbi:Sm-like protein lsm7 [Orobanche gracilis]
MSGRKETVLDLAKFVDKGVQVKLTGGRQGILCLEASDLFIFCIAFIVEPMDEFIDFFVICHWLFYFTGTLKGYDQLLNLVLDEAVEFLRDPEDPLKTTDQTRRLGLIVCRGTAVMLVSPTDGTDEIANPFVQSDGA